MYKAILFDLDDTLLDHQGALRDGVDEWCVSLGLPTGQHARFRELEKKWFAAYERGEVSHPGQRAGRCRDFLDRPEMTEAEALAAYDGYLAAYARNWRAFPDALPVLERAHAAGFKVGVLTNGAREMQQGKLAATGLDLDFVVLIPTVELGTPKPHREAYLAACSIMESSPAETLMVGDSLANDVEGARAAGLDALWFDRAGHGDLASLDELTF